MPSDIVFLISKGKWPSTHLPTGKKLNDSWDCRYRELNVQIHSLDFARLPGNHLKEVSIPLHLKAVVAPKGEEMAVCSGLMGRENQPRHRLLSENFQLFCGPF